MLFILKEYFARKRGGWQDQIAASFGGFNRINFNANGYEVLPIIVSPDRKKQLETNLMMFFTGFTRFSSDIQKINNVSGTENKKKNLKQMYTLVNDAEKILVDKNNNLDDFGYLLNTTWMLKKKNGSSISTGKIDDLYNKGISAGALGGKLLGAGGGGFLLFYVPIEKQNAVKEALDDLMYIPFKFENNGTQIIYYSPEEYDVQK